MEQDGGLNSNIMVAALPAVRAIKPRCSVSDIPSFNKGVHVGIRTIAYNLYSKMRVAARTTIQVARLSIVE
jgi:hypothetical protein